MIEIFGSRGIGKTSQLILKADENNIKYIACAPSSIPHHIQAAYNLGLNSKINFISYEEIKNINEEFLIDDLECCVSNLYKNCKGFCISIPNPQEEEK